MVERCALGVRPKTGSAVLVAVAGIESPAALLRERAVLVDEGDAARRFLFHHAAELAPEAAAAHIETLRTDFTAAATARLGLIAGMLRAKGFELTTLTVAGRPPRPSPSLQRILSSHALIHAAEGAFYGDVWLVAAGRLGLEASVKPEAEACAAMAAGLGVDVGAVAARVRAMGVSLGPPWAVEQRAAALVAWATAVEMG